MPEFLDVQESKQDQLSLMSGLVSQIQNGEREVGHVVNSPTSSGTSTPTSSSASLVQKYGKCQEVIGKGAYGIVRVAHKYDHVTRREVLFAVKEFKKRPSEDEQSFSKRLASEFCISSSLHHPNIIHTLDLMKDARGTCCEVMEYCAGGDLYSLILSSEGGLEPIEADCLFKQLMRGVVYMHSMGVAHCDLKPENLLLTNSGVVKISDFGNGECFRMAWEKEIHLSSGVCGSRPYIAPEEFRDDEYDPRPVDIWATGIIYMAMRSGSYLWQVAVQDEDEFYRRYLTDRKQSNGYEPIERLKRSKCRNVIYSILDPIPSRRITGKQVLNSEWGRSIHLCEAAERGY
jgi:protein-serine/threonine kinase